MEIVAVINTHGEIETTKDTIESVLHYMTDRVLLVVDEASWHIFEKENFNVHLLKGFRHNYYKAPYRNVLLALNTAAKYWPNQGWYCYLEYDCLVGSSKFKDDLKSAEQKDVWCIGNDYRTNEQLKVDLTAAEKILKVKFKEIFYLLGACIFYNKKFIEKALEENFFEKFLFCTNEFKDAFFPYYQGHYAHDIIEHLMPTLAKHWGGKVVDFAKYFENKKTWAGNYKRYPIRYKPQLSIEECLTASIMHPVKSFYSPIREYYRQKRCQ